MPALQVSAGIAQKRGQLDRDPQLRHVIQSGIAKPDDVSHHQADHSANSLAAPAKLRETRIARMVQVDARAFDQLDWIIVRDRALVDGIQKHVEHRMPRQTPAQARRHHRRPSIQVRAIAKPGSVVAKPINRVRGSRQVDGEVLSGEEKSARPGSRHLGRLSVQRIE